jgi:drug/metabolite transporter (DMT)-like permease
MPTTPSAANRRGIVAMSLGMASFLANDGLVKYLSESLPAAQLICIRGLFATVLMLVIARHMGLLRPNPLAGATPLRQLAQGPVLLRSVIDALATMAYLGALFHMPIGNATAINSASPLFLTLYAALMWREPVGPVRWVLIVGGFAGVLLIVQPKAEGFNAWALVCLLATMLHAARDVVTRAIAPTVPSVMVTLATAATVTLVAGAISLFEGWQAVSATQLALLATASVFLSGGYYFVILGMRGGDVSVISPFRYTSLLYALLIGWAVWGDIPNAMAMAGIALLVAAGILMVRVGGRR